MPEALDLIKLRLINIHVELGLTREAADTWTPEGQTLLAVSETICDLFGRPTRTETTAEINDFIYDFNFGFKLGDRSYEETSIQNFKKLLKDHYRPISEIDGTTQDRFCKLLYKKFPKHTELSDYLKMETVKECGTHKDKVENCLIRMSTAIQHMRRLISTAQKWGGRAGSTFEFCSGSTKGGQNLISCQNTHISDSTARGGRFAIGLYSANRTSISTYDMNLVY